MKQKVTEELVSILSVNRQLKFAAMVVS